MDSIRRLLKDLSLKYTFILYMLVFLLLATFLSSLTLSILETAQDAIFFKYYDAAAYRTSVGTVGTSISTHSVRANIVLVDGNFSDTYSPVDRVFDQVLQALTIIAIPTIFLCCTVAASLLFYRHKMRRPVEILADASRRIAAADLDFTIHYDSKDEMGRLCASFEQMRRSLFGGNRELWRTLEERKRLNAAFAHDLRTPLTVLRGYADLLSKYVPQGRISQEKLLDTVSTLSRQVARLESYAASMTALQKLEDIVPSPAPVEASALLRELEETARVLCKSYSLRYSLESGLTGTVSVDLEVVLQVYENLLSNAARFAREQITILCTRDGDRLLLDVMDDGPGFSEKDLLFATRPYYGSEKNGEEGHFGLGLNICKILCEHHGGSLTLGNHLQGGAHIAAAFAIHPPSSPFSFGRSGPPRPAPSPGRPIKAAAQNRQEIFPPKK